MIGGYYFITGAALSLKGDERDTAAAVRAGVRTVQYRDVLSSPREFYAKAKRLRAICKNAAFIINDRIDACLAVDADGVHLGQGEYSCKMARSILGAKKIIGITVHSAAEASRAQQDGADYLGVSPVFSTRTKSDAGRGRGIKLIKNVKKVSRLPVAAIGGIDLENAPRVIEAGADAVCAISAVVTKKDVEKEIHKFQSLFKARLHSCPPRQRR